MRPEQELASDVMPALPLLSHTRPNQAVAWRAGQPVSVSEFLREVSYVATRLPAGQYMLNVCRDRYHFAVGLAAAIITNKISLLPPTHTRDMVQQMRAYSSDIFCLHDQPDCDTELPRMLYPAMPEYHASAQELDEAELEIAIPKIEASQQVAIVFTSGSTGTPLPHIKRWGNLVRNVQAQAVMLGLTNAIHYNIIGTIPPQHMYGFESTVLLAWQNGNALYAGQPFYPADVCSAITECAIPSILVSTPLHLRLLLESDLTVPSAALILSATAPLSIELAHKAEAAFHAPLLEIYGSTETGQIATRRTTVTQEWQLFPGIQLTEHNGQVWAEHGHIELAVPLGDVIEIKTKDYFLLHGRTQDLINIAGKRTSLANLNHHLTSIPGVMDGAFYMPDEVSPDHVTRLTACVVAPGLNPALLLKQLRLRMDAVFLPRPLLFASQLPRNSTGKLPRAALGELIEGLHNPAERQLAKAEAHAISTKLQGLESSSAKLNEQFKPNDSIEADKPKSKEPIVQNSENAA